MIDLRIINLLLEVVYEFPGPIDLCQCMNRIPTSIEIYFSIYHVHSDHSKYALYIDGNIVLQIAMLEDINFVTHDH